jgi:hypothetical protein
MLQQQIIIAEQQPQQFMVTKKYSINTDKLKLCYRIPQDYDLFNYIIEHSGIADLNAEDIEWRTETTKVFFGAEDFYFSVTEFTKNEDNEIIKLLCAVMLPDHTKLGDLEISKVAFVGKAFFSFTNRSLYTPSSNIFGEKHNNVIHLQYIADCLGLSLNNVTNIEIAIDTNFNFQRKVQTYITDTSKEMYLNGRRVKDENTRLKNYFEVKGRTRKHTDKYPTIVIKQVDGLQLKIYNKSIEMRECEQGKLEYIPEWNGFGDTSENEQIYRAEITATREDIRDFYAFLSDFRPDWNEPEYFLYHLLNEDFRAFLWHYSTHRLLYFKDGGQDVDLMDLL